MTTRRLRVLFEDSLARNPAGTGTFARGLREALSVLDDIELLISRMDSEALASVDVAARSAAQRMRNAMRHLRYFAVELPARAQQAGCDVIFSPSSLGPLRGATPSVITVHDLTLLRYPVTVDRLSRPYLTWMLRTQLRRSAAVCTVSHAVAGELRAQFPWLRAAGLHVVPDAPDPALIAADPDADHRVIPPFFLMVGTIEPRKNHLTAIRAFAAYLERNPQARETLVLAGSPGWNYRPVEAEVRALRLERRVLRLGRVEPGRLKWLYQNARALLFPSLYEGFGIPVVEAFALGCPVIAANIASVAEVAGANTAILLQPLDVSHWSRVIEQTAPDPPDPARVAAAKRRADAFSWQASAEALRSALLTVSHGRASAAPQPPARAPRRTPPPPVPPPAAS